MKLFFKALISFLLTTAIVRAESASAKWQPLLPAQTANNWRVYHGAEFPGARGKLTEEPDGGLLLSGEFEDRGVYVAAALKLRITNPGTRINLTAVTDCRIALRCQDRNGHYRQTAAIPLKANEKYILSVTPDQEWPICWGGAEKGKQPVFPYRSIQINAMRMPKSPEVKLRIDDVQVPRGQVFLEPVATPVQFLSAQEAPSPRLVLCNIKEKTLRISGEIQMIAYNGSFRTIKVDQEVPAHETHEIALPIPEKRQGSWRIAWNLTDHGSGNHVAGEDRFSRMIPAGPAATGKPADFLFGIAAHPENYSTREREKMAEAAALCGAHLIRTNARWTYQIQPKPDVWDYQILDSVVDVFSGKGVGIQLILSGCPNWAVAKEWRPKNPATKRPTWGRRPDYAAWRNFVRKTVRRYADRIHLYEIWNEPDLISFANFSTEEYLQLQEIAFQEIKKVSPNLKVISGGLSGYLPAREELFRRIAQSSTSDIFAFHCHGWPGGYLEQIKELRRILKEYPKPWYSNETAISSLSCGEYQQAASLFKKLFTAWENGSIGYTWYNLREKGNNPRDSEHHYGMLTYDFKAKPVYLTFNTLTTLFRGAHREGNFPLASELTAGCFRAADGDLLIPFWQSNLISESLYAIGEIASDKAELIDLMGNRCSIPVKEGMAVIKGSSEPRVLRIPAQAGRPLPLGNLIFTPAVLPVTLGGESTWEFRFRNPSQRPLHWKCSIELPEFVTASYPSKIDLGPGKEKILRIKAQTSSEFSSVASSRRIASLKLGGETLQIPLQGKITLPWKKFPEVAQLQLRHADQVTPLIENEPQTAHLFWHGTDDLSAEIRLARDSENLKLKLNVTDDHHVVKHFNDEAWKSDGVQIGIAMNHQKGIWKIGLSHPAPGQSAVFIWSAPDGFNPKDAATKIRLKSSRDEKKKQTVYEVEIPCETIGLNPQTTESFRFNVLINDNDGEIRESYIALAPGLGDRLDAGGYPVIHLR